MALRATQFYAQTYIVYFTVFFYSASSVLLVSLLGSKCRPTPTSSPLDPDNKHRTAISPLR
eukprot:m.260476 g.260476  ORF g.260476 m.260476 type:complete len:61 (+) comp40436_c2_seq2:40-222(+)